MPPRCWFLVRCLSAFCPGRLNMRLLANENFPADAVQALRTSGYNVLWIREAAPGISDPEVLARTLSES